MSKQKETLDMTQGSLWSNIFKFSLPLIASNLLQVMFNLADIAVIGRFGGASSLGAVGSTATLVVLFTGFLIGMGSGVNALVAHYFGAKEHDEVKVIVQTALAICLALGVILMVLCFLTAGPSLRLLKTKPDLYDKARTYLRIYYLGLPAVALFNMGNGIYSAVGNTKKPLMFLGTAGFLNIALNLIFVIIFHLDVAGVAMASCISQYISAALIITSLLKTEECYGLSKGHEGLCMTHAVRLLKLGIPAGIQYAIFQIANSFILAAVNSFDSIVVAGNAAASNADSIVYDVMAAFYVACTSFISQNYGAGKRDRMIKSYYVCLVYSLAIGLILGGSIYLAGPRFLALFAKDQAVIDAGMKRLSIMALCYGFSAFMDNTIAASRGIGKTAIPTVIVILGSCVFRVIWVYTVFAHFHTIKSLYLLYIFSWTITGVAEIIYFAYAWKTNICQATK